MKLMLVPVVSKVVVLARTLDTIRVAVQVESVVLFVSGSVVQDVAHSVWV